MDRNTPFRDGLLNPTPVAAKTEIFGGHIVALNATGFAVPATATAALLTIGISAGWVDNSAGADGGAQVLVRRDKFFLMVNSTTDPITQARVGQDCFVQDSITVAKTDDNKARPYAGKVAGIESDGVWVYFE